MSEISGLSRSIDPSYPSNRYAVAATFLAGAAGSTAAFVSGDALVASLGWGVLTGGAAFLAWAIGRELDPDRPSTAGLAAPLAAAAVAAGRPSLWAAAGVLLTARVLVRSTGVAPKVPDLVGLMIVAGAAAATSPAGVPAGLVTAGALVADRMLRKPAPAMVAAAGMVVAVIVTVVGVVKGWLLPDPVSFSAGAAIITAAAALGGLSVLGSLRPVSVGDFTGEPLDGTRLRAARIATVASLAGAAAWAGGPGVTALAPAGAALMAVMIPRFGRGRSAT